MGTLAVMMQSQGHEVTGSDEGFYEPMLGYLKSHNIKFFEGHKPENIPEDVDFIVIGKHAKLIPETNEEVAYAFTKENKVMSLPDLLNRLTIGKQNMVCAGSFGKSTVTTAASFVLEHAGKNPSYFIGAVPLDMADSGVLKESNLFVLEGDEYPSSNWDARAKFLHYNPTSVILTSCEHDHINVYPTLESYLKPFQDLLSILPEDGLLVYHKNGENINDVLDSANCSTISYGIDQTADYYASNIIFGEVTEFDLYKRSELITKIKTNLLGKHNIENIVGVSAMLLEKGMVTADELVNALTSFHGVKGRLNRLDNANTVPIIESYGSSYAKAKADIEAIKLHFPTKNIINIFEPHTFGWRNKLNANWYSDVFNGCSTVYIFHPPTHGAGTIDQFTQDEIVELVKNSGVPNVVAVQNKSEVYEHLKNDLNENSLIVLTTSGSLDDLPEEIASKI